MRVHSALCSVPMRTAPPPWSSGRKGGAGALRPKAASCFVGCVWTKREEVFMEFSEISLSSVQSLSRVWLFVTPWITAGQASLSITNSQSLPKLSITCPLSWWCHPTISSSFVPSPPAFSLPQHQGLFQWVSSCHQVAKVLEFQLQHQSFQWIFRVNFLQDGLVGSPCSPRDSQESSPTPQFKNNNSSVLTLLYSPTLTSIHDYWKNHSLD